MDGSAFGWQQPGHRWEYRTVDELIDACERFDHISHQVGRLVQQYVVGGEQIHVHVRFLVGGESHGVCVSFVGFRYTGIRSRSFVDWFPGSVYEVERGSLYEQVQAPVFVPIIQRDEGEEGMRPWKLTVWPSVERLQRLERCLGSARGAIELPLEASLAAVLPPLVDALPRYAFLFGKEGGAVDRELVALVLLLAGALNEGADEIVKGCADVVDELPDSDRPCRIDAFERYLKAVLAGVRIEFTRDGLTISVFDRFPKNVEVVHRPAPPEFIVPQKLHGRDPNRLGSERQGISSASGECAGELARIVKSACSRTRSSPQSGAAPWRPEPRSRR